MGYGFSQAFSSEISSTTEESFTIQRNDKQEGLALWQFEFLARDSCADTSILTKAYTFTSGITQPPACMPSYCATNDDPLGRCCTCKDGPNGEDTKLIKNPQPCAADTMVCTSDMEV